MSEMTLDDLKFNQNGLYTLNTAEKNGAQLSVGGFNSFMTIAVWENRSKVYGISFQRRVAFAFKEAVKEMLGFPNDKRVVVAFGSKWNNDLRKSEQEYVINGGRDTDGIFFLEIKYVGAPAYRFLFKGTTNFSHQSDRPSAAEASHYELKVFLDFLTNELPIHRALGTFRYKPQGRGRPSSNKESSRDTSKPSDTGGGSEGSYDDAF